MSYRRMVSSERTARMAQNLLYGILHEIRNRVNYEAEARSEAVIGIEQLTAIVTIRTVAGRMPADISSDGLLDELLGVAARNLAASGKAFGAALLREMYCLDET